MEDFILREIDRLGEDRKQALLSDALAYLDGKGYFSFRLHSLGSD